MDASPQKWVDASRITVVSRGSQFSILPFVTSEHLVYMPRTATCCRCFYLFAHVQSLSTFNELN